jgi:hypothetical protein
MTAPPFDVNIVGDSAQNVVGTVVSGDVIQNMNTFVRGRPPMYLSSAEVTDRVACYVPARNHDLAVKALEVSQALVLTGPPGSGRETTAIAAMRQLRPGMPIRRFSLDDDAEEIYVKGACGYLIRTADGGLAGLGRCVDAVRAVGGYLAIVGDHHTEHHPATESLCLMVVEPPHPVQVYRVRVAHRGLTEWPRWDRAPALLELALPADARRLADIVEAVHRRGGDMADRQAEVTRAYRGWEDELRDWFHRNREPHDRTLLVAAATLSPTADDALVYSAAASLARRLQITINGDGLAWCPVTGLHALLGAQHEEGQVVFRRHGFAESALRHTLADYPLARKDVLAWLAALPTDETIQNAQQNSLAATFADLAAEHGTPELITETAREWGAENLADLAFIAISRTCLHPRVGGRVRRALYDWSRQSRTPQTLKLAIARACEPLGQTYPLIALTRLKHLATYGNPQVRSQVLAAAQALNAFGHHGEVLMAALAWCAETNDENLSPKARRRRRLTGAMLFLDLARPVTDSGIPEVLASDRPVAPAACVPGWQTALSFYTQTSGPGDLPVEDAVNRWLNTSLHHVYLRERISSAFIKAAIPPRILPGGGRETGPPMPTTAEAMIGMVRRWAATDHKDPVRREIKDSIVIPLTRLWWIRLLKRMHIRLRTLVNKARTL